MVTETETFDLPEGSDIVTVNTEDNTIEVEYQTTPDNVIVFTDNDGFSIAIDAESEFEIGEASGSTHKFELGTEVNENLTEGYDYGSLNFTCQNLDYSFGYFFNKMEYMPYEEFKAQHL